MTEFDRLPSSRQARLAIEFAEITSRGKTTFDVRRRTTTYALQTDIDVEFVARYLSMRGLKFSMSGRTIVMQAGMPS